MKNAPKNASYISKTTQNELIKSCGQIITDTIINEVKRNKYFSLIVDEAADCSSKEQLSLVLRFVDDNQNIREDFVRLLHCKWGLSGESPIKLVLDELINFNLSIDDCTPPQYYQPCMIVLHLLNVIWLCMALFSVFMSPQMGVLKTKTSKTPRPTKFEN